MNSFRTEDGAKDVVVLDATGQGYMQIFGIGDDLLLRNQFERVLEAQNRD
jgi:hypothetical protein